ncbi:hypothetical protein JCM14036_01280 [Desulfotomaculum defluvii]
MSSILTERFTNALVYASRLHANQVRKLTIKEREELGIKEIPYIGHLLAVTSIVIEDGGSEDEVIAALLHDAVEDQGGLDTLSNIKSLFGDGVASIVLACSDTSESPKPPWRQRKERYLAHLEQSDLSLRVSLADKIHNVKSILRDQKRYGDVIWERFNCTRDECLWYYTELSKVFLKKMPGILSTDFSSLVVELRQLVNRKSINNSEIEEVLEFIKSVSVTFNTGSFLNKDARELYREITKLSPKTIQKLIEYSEATCGVWELLKSLNEKKQDFDDNEFFISGISRKPNFQRNVYNNLRAISKLLSALSIKYPELELSNSYFKKRYWDEKKKDYVVYEHKPEIGVWKKYLPASQYSIIENCIEHGFWKKSLPEVSKAFEISLDLSFRLMELYKKNCSEQPLVRG